MARKLQPRHCAKPPIATVGEFFPDGTVLDLASSAGKIGLVHWNGKHASFHERAAVGGRTYQPASAHPTVLSAIHLPCEAKNFGSASTLFSKIIAIIRKFFDLPARDSELVAFWVLATWFADVLPTAPTLLIAGPSPSYASSFLALLRCLCRRGVRIADLNPAGFRALPMRLQPTLLVEATTLTRSMIGLLKTSGSRGVYVTQSGKFLDLHCAKALIIAENDFGTLMEAALCVSLVPPNTDLAILTESTEKQIADEFQPLLLHYRLRNHRTVRESSFNASGLTPGLRELAHSLGSAVVGDEELAGHVVPLLTPIDAAVRARQACLPEPAIVAVALALIHEGKERQVLVKNFTPLVNALLRNNGEILEYSPEEIGWRLYSLGLHSHRIPGGRGVRLDRDFSRSVHELARRLGVEGKMPPEAVGCPDCRKTVQSADSKMVTQVLSV